MVNRKGASLIEVLIVMAILALMIGLLLSAVQKVRSTAAGLQDKNRLRQIILAGHNYASASGGAMPSATSNESVYYLEAVLPYLGVNGPTYYESPPNGPGRILVPVYITGSDYSIENSKIPMPSQPGYVYFDGIGPASLGLNALALDGVTNLASHFSDGTSNTIGLSERLYNPQYRDNYFIYTGTKRRIGHFEDFTIARANFAEANNNDVVPVTEGFPPRTRASRPGTTFQAVPTLFDSDGRQLQALQPGGLKVAMLDGSVRTIHPGVSEGTFWGLVTPAAGDIAEID